LEIICWEEILENSPKEIESSGAMPEIVSTSLAQRGAGHGACSSLPF